MATTRKIKEAKDLSTNELIYFKGHAKATYMSDGTTVEDAINQNISSKQDKLISGSNIKTINGTSLLGEGDILINSGKSEDIYTLVVDMGNVDESTLTISGSVSAEEFEKIYKSKILFVSVYVSEEGSEMGVDYIFAQTTSKLNIPGYSTSAVFYSISEDMFYGETIAKRVIEFYGNSDGSADWELRNIPLFKTINGESILGEGDIVISGGSSSSSGSSVYITPFTVSDILGNLNSIELTKEQVKGLMEAASQNSILCVPYSLSSAGMLVISYEYFNDSTELEVIKFIILSDGIEKTVQLRYNADNDSWYWNGSYTHRISLSYKSKYVDVDENIAFISSEHDSYQYDSYLVNGECVELHCYLEPQERPITIHFLTGENCTIEIMIGAQWANGVVPNIEPYTEYELSLIGNAVGTFNAILTPFKTVE